MFLLTSNSLKIHTLHLYDLLTIKCLCLGYKSFTDDDIIAGSFKRCSNVKSVYKKEKRDYHTANKYMLKVSSNRNTRKRSKICSRLILKIQGRRQ